jgi:ABC-2 type transport system ATP-binding protein
MKTLLFHNTKIGRGEKIFLNIDSDKDKFTISQGLTLIVAPNGHGKSTILQALSGNLPLLSGSVELRDNGKQLIDEVLYVSEYLAFPKYIYPQEWIEFVVQEKINTMELLDISKKLNFDHKLNSYLGRMSQGERRKVTWLCAYFSKKELIFMDEPLDGLDLLALPVIKEILKKWNEQARIVVMITHQPYDVLPLSHEVLFLKNEKFITVKCEMKSVLDFEGVVKKYYFEP